jgi:hypothetical protein
MRTELTHGDSFHNVIIPGTILLAGVDVSGLMEYALRAGLGALIWLASKQAGEYLQRRKARKEAQTRMNRIRNRRIKKGTHGNGE